MKSLDTGEPGQDAQAGTTAVTVGLYGDDGTVTDGGEEAGSLLFEAYWDDNAGDGSGSASGGETVSLEGSALDVASDGYSVELSDGSMTLDVGTVAAEAVACRLIPGTLDQGVPEVCQDLVDQVARVGREARVDRDRLEDHGPCQVVVVRDLGPATGCVASGRCRSSLLPVTGRVIGSGGRSPHTGYGRWGVVARVTASWGTSC